MKTQKLAKRTLFVFKKKLSRAINNPTTVSDPTTVTVSTSTGIIL
ncbi:hypothetical protein ACQKLS_04700 [Pedobacter suwonensis]